MPRRKDKNSDDEGEEAEAQGGVTSSTNDRQVDTTSGDHITYRDEEDGLGLFVEK